MEIAMQKFALVAVGVMLAGAAVAQSNTVPGLDGRIENIDSLTYWGRRGSAHPSGEVGMSMLNTMCNPGSVTIPWYAAMQPNHPKFGFMIVRESGGRFEQINDWSYVKHAFASTNGSGACGSCINPGTSSVMGVHCSDTYGAGNNGDRYWLGPPGEIDPWLGSWNPIGSYFDRGDPPVSGAAATDGIRSLTSAMVSAFDPVKNLVTVQEQDLLTPGASYYYGIHLIHEGEAQANRMDNLASRGFNPAWSGSSWTFNNNASGLVHGSILQHWQGATVDSAQNGNDDGAFFVGVKVTGPVNNLYHYEYVVYNFDNTRGGASLRIPVCTNATVSNLGFRDIDHDPLDDWSATVQNGEIAFSATASNPLNWNTLYNFWFDCSAAPLGGMVHVDEARIGPGNLTVDVNSQIPGGVAQVVDLGPGCGNPAPALAPLGTPSIPSANFAFLETATPGANMILFAAANQANAPIGNGCTRYLDNQSMVTLGVSTMGVTGINVFHLNVPNNTALEGLELSFQGATVQAGGPVFGTFALTNGLKVRIGNNLHCP
jgi:hypothetical protein